MNSVQHIAGRLRLKFPELKNKNNHARAVEKAIRQMPSVRLVQANAITGSILIHYDARGAQQVGLLDNIEAVLTKRFGLRLSYKLSNIPTAAALPFESHAMTGRVVDMMIDKIVERSALALLGVLL